MEKHCSRLELFSLHLKEPPYSPLSVIKVGMEKIKSYKGPMEKCVEEQRKCHELLDYKKKFLVRYERALKQSEKLFDEMQAKWDEEEKQDGREEQTEMDLKVLRDQRGYIAKLKDDIGRLEKEKEEVDLEVMKQKKIVMERIDVKKRTQNRKEIRKEMEVVKRMARAKTISRAEANEKLKELEKKLQSAV